MLAGFLKEGKQEQAIKYLEEMTGQFSEVQKVISTGSDILDAILNDKLRECEEKKISMKVEGVLRASLAISDYDICTILVNAREMCRDSLRKRGKYCHLSSVYGR